MMKSPELSAAHDVLLLYWSIESTTALVPASKSSTRRANGLPIQSK